MARIPEAPSAANSVSRTRLCGLKGFDELSNGGDLDHCEVVVFGFFVPCGDSSTLLESSDHSFDDVSFPVCVVGKACFRSFVGASGNDILDPTTS